jgi:hypothetical protein
MESGALIGQGVDVSIDAIKQISKSVPVTERAVAKVDYFHV